MNSNRIIDALFEVPKTMFYIYAYVALCLLSYEKYTLVSNVIFYSGLIHAILFLLKGNDVKEKENGK